MSNRKWLMALLTALAVAVVGVGTAVAISESPEITEHAERDDDESVDDTAEDAAVGADTPITDEAALERASEAALSWLEQEHGLTGEVTDTEVDDEESYYEIEVELADGRQVDVQLTEAFEVVGLD